MHHMHAPGRHAAPSTGAAAQPPQSDQESWILGQSFANLHEKTLRDCALAAYHKDRATRMESVASAAESLLGAMDIPGRRVTRSASGAPPEAASAAPGGAAIPAAAKPARISQSGGQRGAAGGLRIETRPATDAGPAAAEAAPHHVALRLPKGGFEAIERGGAGGALSEPHWADGAHPDHDPGSLGGAEALRGGAGGALSEPHWEDGTHRDPDPDPAGAAGAPREGAAGAFHEPHWEDGAHRGPSNSHAGAAGPDGDWRAQADVPANAGAFDNDWDGMPDDCGPPDGWEPDGGDIAGGGAPDDAAAHDRRGAAHARGAGGRRQGVPRLGRWAAAGLLAAAAAVMVWIGGDGIARLAGWRASPPAPAQHGTPDGGAAEIRRMVSDALKDAPGDAAPPVDSGLAPGPGDGAEDLRGMIADAPDGDRAPGGAGCGPADSAHEDGADGPQLETPAFADAIDPASAAEAAHLADPAGVRLARIERRIASAERGAVSTGGLIGALGDAIADATARMEAMERGRAAIDSRLADLERRAAAAGGAGERATGLRARLDETDTVVLDIAARVAALEAEAGAFAMADGPGGARAPQRRGDWGPDPFAAEGARTEWDGSADDNPVYRRIPAAAGLVRDKDGRLIPVFVETPAAAAPQGG